MRVQAIEKRGNDVQNEEVEEEASDLLNEDGEDETKSELLAKRHYGEPKH